MARKSRKQVAVEEPVIESVASEVFPTAIYARLSVENSGKSEWKRENFVFLFPSA